MTLLLLAGDFDLSVGSMLAFTGVVTVWTFNATDNMWVGILAGLLTGPLIGAINGYLVTVQGMNSLMTTLGMMFALRGTRLRLDEQDAGRRRERLHRLHAASIRERRSACRLPG